MQSGDGKRREDRLLGSEVAVMVMPDGQKVAGHMGDMSLGGMLFVAEDANCPSVERGVTVEVSLTLYGRESQFSCTVAHQRANCFGLQLQRS